MPAKIDEHGGWLGVALYAGLTALLSGGVVGAILSWQFDKQIAELNSALQVGREVKRESRENIRAALVEFYSPAAMYLGRTRSVSDRYRQGGPRSTYADALILRDSNSAMRQLLIHGAHYIPTEHLPVALCLLTHYDIWLKRFDLTLEKYQIDHPNKVPGAYEAFDVGFSELEDRHCGGFPPDAPRIFEEQFKSLRKGIATPLVAAASPSN